MRAGYVAVEDLANELGINISTVWRWLKRDGVTTVKFRGDRRAYITVAQADMFRVPIGEQEEPPPG